MSSTIVAVSLTLALNSFGLAQGAGHQHHYHFDYIMPPGPGDGWGFPNGNPDGYGFVDYDVFLPLGAGSNRRVLLPAVFLGSSRTNHPSDLLQPIRDARPALHPVLRRRRRSPDGRAAARIVAPAGLAIRGRSRRRAGRQCSATARTSRGPAAVVRSVRAESVVAVQRSRRHQATGSRIWPNRRTAALALRFTFLLCLNGPRRHAMRPGHGCDPSRHRAAA